MLAPAGLPHLPVLFSATAALALLTPLALAAAETSTAARQAIQSGLPRYDPGAYEKAQAEQAARAAPKHSPAPLPEPIAASTGTSATPTGNTLELPKITVLAKTEPPKHLPRIDTVKPVEVEKVDLMESPASRDARLVKKHLSKLEQALNRFPRIFGVSAVALARDTESREQKAAQMNELAAGIELQQALGRDPEDIKKLRAEYIKLYYSGPK
jgi:hypothetical protein